MLDGRVKTLHPLIHGGLLGVRDLPSHMAQMQEHNIQPIDLVCVNLYPFKETISKPNFTHEEAKLLDLCLICHGDHGGGNNSTFTDRVVSSTGSDTYSAIASAILSLKGPRHGGANLKVMEQLDNMIQAGVNPQSDASVYEALKQILTKQSGDRSGLVYGIGHAVYTKSDPRAQILKTYSYDLSRIKGFEKEYDLLCMIEKLAPEVFKEVKGTTKNICANVDFYSGFVYNMLGLPNELFTPIFAISRISGGR